MAWGQFLNFEKISIEIIQNEIALMTDDNRMQAFPDDVFLDDDILKNNLYHGSIAVVFIANLYETALNSILRCGLNISDFNILRKSHYAKLQYICKKRKIDIALIEQEGSYKSLASAITLRNDITHYKYNDLGMGTFIGIDATIPNGKSSDTIAKMFTKSYMQDSYGAAIKVLKLICEKCDLLLNMGCEVIDCDGRDCACEFILPKGAYIERDIENENLSQ